MSVMKRNAGPADSMTTASDNAGGLPELLAAIDEARACLLLDDSTVIAEQLSSSRRIASYWKAELVEANKEIDRLHELCRAASAGATAPGRGVLIPREPPVEMLEEMAVAYEVGEGAFHDFIGPMGFAYDAMVAMSDRGEKA